MVKKVLVLFETSGAVSVPFREFCFDVITIDILPHMIDNEHHIQADIREIEKLKIDYSDFDLLIAFPPCTYFSKAGLRYLKTQPERKKKQLADLEMIKKLWNIPIKHKCFENPSGSALNKLWKKANCKIDYRDYADFAKPTYLWIENLPPLLSEQINLKRYGNFITRMSYGSYKRNITPIEVGYAMVKQWSCFL